MYQEPIQNIEHKIRKPILGDNIKKHRKYKLYVDLNCLKYDMVQ